jgi:hypothetical protein
MFVLHRQRIPHLKLARKSSITHPLGVVVETPLLVPSFSSKGFLFKKTKTRLISEVADFMDVSAEVLTESMLVSAYDVHHKHIQPLTQIAKIAAIVFIDSGGYEVADAHDLPAVFKHPLPPLGIKWTEATLKKVLGKWPKHSPAVFVSFDNSGRPFARQLAAARKLFAHYPDQMHDMILKPDQSNAALKPTKTGDASSLTVASQSRKDFIALSGVCPERENSSIDFPATSIASGT